MRFIITALVFVMVAGSFQSCVSKKKFDELAAAKAATDQALAQTQAQVKTLAEEKDALSAKLTAETTRLNNEINSVRTEMTTQLSAANQKLAMTEAELKTVKDEINGMFAAYTNAGLTMDNRDGRLYLMTEQPVNFRSGSSSLTRDQRNAVDALATKLKANPAVKVLVEGHTDNKQFASGSSTDNWDLSYARAKAVATRLIRQGVNPNQVALAGYGDNAPMGDNATKEGRAANRRSAVAPNPNLGGLMKSAGKN